MTKEVAQFIIKPTSLAESMKLAEMIANSSFAPKDMRGKPGDVILALQMGADVGLSPIQSIQNIAVINGKPSLYGDATLAVVMSSPHYEYHNEWFTGSIAEGNRTAHCAVKRKGSEEYVKSFSMDDAKKAGLWGKPGPWTQYSDRMLQMRARTFAIRDKFADAMRGINIADSDYSVIENQDKQAPAPKAETYTDAVIVEATPELEPNDELFNKHLLAIRESQTIDDLKANYKLAANELATFTSAIKIINQATKLRRKKLEDVTTVEAHEVNAGVNSETGEVENVAV